MVNKKEILSDLYDKLKDVIPDDHSYQVIATYFTDLLFECKDIQIVMDLGCGAGNSIDYFRKKNPNVKWIGLDIESSPEVNSRTRADGEFRTFDGINIPFKEDYFDLIYCNQVFEHVQYPRKLLKEVNRVLKQRGYFVGSVSHLEPYHSYSLWNYTPYGFALLIKEAGLELVEIRPSIDALTLITRRGFVGGLSFLRQYSSRYWRKESPLNQLVNIITRIMRKNHKKINLIKLVLCGQFCFLVQKPSSEK